jgi:hypothetical protein
MQSYDYFVSKSITYVVNFHVAAENCMQEVFYWALSRRNLGPIVTSLSFTLVLYRSAHTFQASGT